MKPSHPAEPEKPDPYDEWHKAEPPSPAKEFRTTRFGLPQQCGQGPYRLAVETAGAPFSEGVRVTICTAHVFKGSVSYLGPQSWAKKSENGFGFTQDSHHDKCRVDGVGVVAAGTPSSSGGAAPAKPGAHKVDPGATATPVAVELHGEIVGTTTERCPDGQQEIWVLDVNYPAGVDPNSPPPLPRGRFTVDVWSDLPNDLTGASVIVRQRGVPAGYRPEDWAEYRRRWEEWFGGRDDALARSRAAGHKWTSYEQPGATKQPPPARAEVQPPRPSPNAAWIPGYWHDSDGWEWSAGFWRVPQQDIEQEKTVEAPAPPPAPKTDAAPPADVAFHTTRKAVWTPGYWMWNGATYVWIVGAWRIPESAGMTWIAPTWRPTRRGTSIYIPGGFVRVRPRR